MTNRARVHHADVAAVHVLIGELQSLESRAHRLKMTETAQALNAAKNKAGWELAEQLTRMNQDKP